MTIKVKDFKGSWQYYMILLKFSKLTCHRFDKSRGNLQSRCNSCVKRKLKWFLPNPSEIGFDWISSYCFQGVSKEISGMKMVNKWSCKIKVAVIWLFHNGGPYHIETIPLTCSANQWISFYMTSRDLRH